MKKPTSAPSPPALLVAASPFWASSVEKGKQKIQPRIIESQYPLNVRKGIVFI